MKDRINFLKVLRRKKLKTKKEEELYKLKTRIKRVANKKKSDYVNNIGGGEQYTKTQRGACKRKSEMGPSSLKFKF